MSNQTITQQPESTTAIFTLLPDEYVRFEYHYKPGCCCFSSKTTTVTNMRLITRVVETPTICSTKTSSGKEKDKAIFLTDLKNIKQLQSAIPASENSWWMKCIDILSCRCSNQRIDWVELCRGMENLTVDSNESTVKNDESQEPPLVEKF